MNTIKMLSLSISLFCATTGNSQTITTIAGTHTAGYSGNGGPATGADMSKPNQVFADRMGNVYIAERGNEVVRKVDAAGVITLFAGKGTAGHTGDGGQATAAELAAPEDVAMDAAGNLYICEKNNNCIRKIDAAGVITTIAGKATAGFSGDGGPATAAELNRPMALYIDKTDNIFVADEQNRRVRKITPAGIISTIAGNDTAGYSGDGGPATAAKFTSPIDVTGDKAGNIYIADLAKNVIRKIDVSGIITTVAGNTAAGFSGDGGPATAAKLNAPYAVSADSADNIYITDNANNRIRKVTTSGIISTLAGTGTPGYSGDGGPATAAEFYNAGGISFDSSNNMYIADYGNNVVRKITFPNTALKTVAAAEPIAKISLYPNPACDIIQVGYSNFKSERTILNISDMTGKVVVHKIVTVNKNGILAIDVSDLIPATYIVTLTTATQQFTSGFTKNH